MCEEREGGRLVVMSLFLSFKLESLPREELIKYVKKQAQLLQKTKAHCNGQYSSFSLFFLFFFFFFPFFFSKQTLLPSDTRIND